MLKEVKAALFVTEPDYDADIADLIQEAIADLRIAGVTHYDGTVSFKHTDAGITERCTIKDDLIIRYVKTYCRVHFGSPADYDRLHASLVALRCTLQHSTGYGRPEVY